MKYKTLLISLLLIANCATAQDRLEQMISPVFHPTNFEDPRSQSEVRPIYIYHELDNSFATEGGDVQLYALQLRYALDDRWAVIATKDGYIDFNPNKTLPKDTGWADLSAGVKYAFYKDEAAGQIASAQLRYILPTGDEEVLQGSGDGSIHPSVSSAIALSDQFTLTSATGLRIPMDTSDSFMWDVDTQLDYRIDMCGWSLHPLIGASLIHTVDGGDRLPITSEGQDLFNFGASAATGENIVVGAAGLRARVTEDVDLGMAFQFPFDQEDENSVINNRWTFDTIVRF